MSNASRDQNRVPTLIGVSSSGFTIPETVAVDPTTHRMLVTATGTVAISNFGVGGGETWDRLDVTNDSATQDTLDFTLGGSPVKTITIIYPTGADKVSDAITSVEYS